MDPLLGDFSFDSDAFSNVEESLAALKKRVSTTSLERTHCVSSTLLGLIQQAPKESFLLPAVIKFIHRVRVLVPEYRLADFELWLNQCSGLGSEGNERVRAKIVGKHLPRDEYQAYFPIGMGRRHVGSHYVTGHNPPDLDTTVASFWGWVDAFGARVSKHLHWWNLPGGKLPTQAHRLFDQLLGADACSVLARADTELTVIALDLVRQKGLERHPGEALTSTIDHGRYDKLVIMTNEAGAYQGCWRTVDVEKYRLATLLVRNTWRWFEHRLHSGLLSLFANSDLAKEEVAAFIQETLDHSFEGTEGLISEHLEILDRLLCRVIGVTRGVTATFEDLLVRLEDLEIAGFADLRQQLLGLRSGPLFEGSRLTGDRTILFSVLADLQAAWAAALAAFRNYLDRLDTALAIKHEVFDGRLHFVTPDSDLDTMRESLGPFQFLPVVARVGDQLLPIGVIHASDLSKRTLGTATLRDFCNREEVKIPSHVEVISVVDHHRSHLHTIAAPTALVGDVQSCNVLLAEQAFTLNDRYGLGGIDPEAKGPVRCPRLLKRRAQRQLAHQIRGDYFVHPKREFAEYLSFLYAILDDTDLLSRVSTRDVMCVASLINRMKSIACGRDVAQLTLDDIPRGPSFAKQAARRILDDKDMYSLYGAIYAQREKEVAQDLARCLSGEPSSVFADTKEQKGCARVGQTKIFPNNFPTFVEHSSQFREVWLERAQESHRGRPDLDLHIQMITTIPGAEEVYRDNAGEYSHCDELWIWIPATSEARNRLDRYLKSFASSPEVARLAMDVALKGSEAKALKLLFEEYLSEGSLQVTGAGEIKGAIAVLRFKAAAITSRKLVITPAIP